MPIIDARDTSRECQWCGTTTKTFACGGCGKRTCAECQVYCSEDGTCEHHAFKPLSSQSWEQDIIPTNTLDTHA